tara:strand:- start:220 stop:357 length:138 start_codon:yes stop_codon:yes gene_type:complete
MKRLCIPLITALVLPIYAGIPESKIFKSEPCIVFSDEGPPTKNNG